MGKSKCKVIYATDLDRTVIFSNRFVTEIDPTPMELLSVSERTDTMESYVLKEYVERLQKLKDSLMFVPVTSRSIAEYNRVMLSKFAQYAIVTNGCHIMFNGKVYKVYDEYLKNEVIDFKKFQDSAILGLFKIAELEKEPKIIDGTYVFAKVKNPDEDTSDTIKTFNESSESVIIERNGRKLYATPKKINKGTALTWLVNHLGLNGDSTKIVASGDSIMDAHFIKEADIKIVPMHGQLLNELPDWLKDIETVPSGPLGTLKTLDICENILNNV